MPNINDKFTKTFNQGNPEVTTVRVGRPSGTQTLECHSLLGWATDTAVHFSTYALDADEDMDVLSQIDWKGIVNENRIENIQMKWRAQGSIDEDPGNSIDDVVVMNPTASWGNDLIGALLVQHAQDGTHKDISEQSLKTTSQGVLIADDEGVVRPGKVTPENVDFTNTYASGELDVSTTGTKSVDVGFSPSRVRLVLMLDDNSTMAAYGEGEITEEGVWAMSHVSRNTGQLGRYDSNRSINFVLIGGGGTVDARVRSSNTSPGSGIITDNGFSLNLVNAGSAVCRWEATR